MRPASRSRAAVRPRVRMPAEPGSLSHIRHFVEDQAIALGADPAIVPDVVQAADEAVTNVIVHGYRGGPGIVEVEVRVTAGTLVVRVRDQAPTFDPTTVPRPDLSRPLEQRPLGGMGVHLMRELTDDITHRSPEGWSNELTLVKRVPSHVTEGR